MVGSVWALLALAASSFHPCSLHMTATLAPLASSSIPNDSLLDICQDGASLSSMTFQDVLLSSSSVFFTRCSPPPLLSYNPSFCGQLAPCHNLCFLFFKVSRSAFILSLKGKPGGGSNELIYLFICLSMHPLHFSFALVPFPAHWQAQKSSKSQALTSLEKTSLHYTNNL